MTTAPNGQSANGSASALPHGVDVMEQQFQQLKSTIHRQLIVSLDLSKLGRIDRAQLTKHVRVLAEKACSSRRELLGRIDRERLLEDLMDEVFGLGPLQPLLDDPEVSDILVNDPYNVFIERRGRLERTNIIFADEGHLMRIIQRIVGRLGRRIDEVSPMVDARLPDGSRVNATVPPIALDGPSLSIRRFGQRPLTVGDLTYAGSLPQQMVEFLRAVVEARIGCLISGGTGAGKTTLLNCVSRFVPADERIITIEDSAELVLQTKHCVRLETRPPNTEGKGEITQRELVRNSLRMRPDRIIVGEVRGPEVWDMLQAMNTGHDGSLTTVHANGASDALARLEMMVAMTGFDLPLAVVRQYIAAGIRLVVHVARLKGGPRCVTQIAEIDGIEDGHYRLREIFGFRRTGVSRDGVAQGEFYATGYQPRLLERIGEGGIALDNGLLSPWSSPAEFRPPVVASDTPRSRNGPGGNGHGDGAHGGYPFGPHFGNGTGGNGTGGNGTGGNGSGGNGSSGNGNGFPPP